MAPISDPSATLPSPPSMCLSKGLSPIWPKGKTVIPKAENEVKLISSGKILENNKTVGQCKVPLGDIGGGVLIMHVVVQPSLAKTKAVCRLDCQAEQQYIQPTITAFYSFCLVEGNMDIMAERDTWVRLQQQSCP